ncbi:CHAT domain-containing protein [Nocardia sp. NPDC019395]|uniref:CHAT domain-containing protein n=1 Tax=Nocardia sp. NPDC019395 TaxID=3154686 RepID=UPI0033C40EEA
MSEDMLKHNQLARRAMWLLMRAEKRRSLRRIRAAQHAFEDVVTVMAPDHPDRPACLVNLGAAYRMLFEHTGSVDDIDRMVQVTRLIVAELPERHVDRIRHRQNLRSLVAQTVVAQSDNAEMLHHLIPLAREASADPVHGPVFLEALAICLGASARAGGDPDVVGELIDVERRRVASLSLGGAERATALTDLAASMLQLVVVTADRSLLGEIVGVARQAVEACPPGHEDRARALSTLGNSLHALFTQRDRQPATLEEAIAIGRDAVSAAPAGHPARPSCSTNLSIALREYYEETRDLESLREAVRISRAAVESAGPDHPGRVNYLNNLSANCQELFKRTGDLEWILLALRSSEEAVALSPYGSVLWANRLAELGNVRHILADAPYYLWPDGDEPRGGPSKTDAGDGGYADSDEILRSALTAQRAAAETNPQGATLSNLATVARSLFERTGDHTVLDEAVRAAHESVAAFEPGTPERARALLGLIRALGQRRDGPVAIDEIHACCRELVADRATPRTQVLAHRILGRVAMALDPPRLDIAGAAYEIAIARLPELAPRRLLRPDREHGLAEFAGLSGEAAAVALRLGGPEQAIQVSEQSRGLLLRESMGGRGDLGELRRVDPDAADEFVRLRDLLDASDQGGTDLYCADIYAAGDPPPGSGDRLSRHRRLASHWEELLARIRRLPGMEGFLGPPTLESLRDARPGGPVVVVNVSTFGCDAILLMVDGSVRRLPLDCAYAELQERAEAFRNLGFTEAGARAESEILGHLAWLWDRIARPVLAATGLLSDSPRTAAEAPRLWWCPVGVAAFLPLHAAGNHDGNSTSTVLHHVVSSYTTTIGALRHARTRSAVPVRSSGQAGRDLLIVRMSRTPGAPALPGAEAEARRVAQLVPSSTTLADTQATRDTVRDAMPGHRITHFACHAVTEPRSPALNRLLLTDHESAPLTGFELSTSDLPDVELAYLSACSTARSSIPLADETVHIAAGFQLAGYRHVVATLWPVPDKAAGRIAEDFYTRLLPALSTGDTARALHRATSGLRADAPDRPSRWAAHIHFGP